jgi:hypothetical protein
MSAQVHSLYSAGRLRCYHGRCRESSSAADERCAAGDGSRKTAAPLGCVVKNSCYRFSLRQRRGALYYTERDMALSHKGMKISASDWAVLFWQERRPISRESRAPINKGRRSHRTRFAFPLRRLAGADRSFGKRSIAGATRVGLTCSSAVDCFAQGTKSKARN